MPGNTTTTHADGFSTAARAANEAAGQGFMDGLLFRWRSRPRRLPPTGQLVAVGLPDKRRSR